jgi:hypothetical protein
MHDAMRNSQLTPDSQLDLAFEKKRRQQKIRSKDTIAYAQMRITPPIHPNTSIAILSTLIPIPGWRRRAPEKFPCL